MADAGTTLGKAYVQIMPSAAGIKGRLESVLGGEIPAAGKSAGNSLGQSLVSTLKKVIAAAGIGAAFKASLSEGMDLQQNLGGTEAVFGDFAGSIKATAADAYKSMGMSASEYMATANKMGSLFQGSGLEQQQALDLTTQAMQRAADVASVMGIDTSMAMESIAGAAKGNFTMMDNLGVAMNATTLEAYALEKGVNFKWNTASNAEKAQLAMQMFMERTSQYEGNFARESQETLAGSLGAMQSAFKNVLGNLAVGADVVPALQSLVATASSFLMGNLLPAVGNILSGLPDVVGTLVQGIQARLPELLSMAGETINSLVNGITENLPLLITGAVNIMTGLGTYLRENLPTLLQSGLELLTGFAAFLGENASPLIDAALALIQSLAQGLINSLPLLLPAVQQIIVAFGGFITENLPRILEAGVSLVHNLVTGILNGLPDFLAQLPVIITSFLDFIAQNLPLILQAGWDILTELFDGIMEAVPMLLDAAPEILGAIENGLTGIRDGLLSVGRNVVEGIGQGILAAGDWLMEQVSGFLSGIVDGAKNLLGIHSPSTVFAGIGKNIALGLGNGIRNGAPEVSKAIRGLVSNMDTGPVSFGISARPVQPSASAYQQVAGNTGSNRQVIIQSGAIVINAAPGQNERAIADMVMERAYRMVRQKETAFA